MSVFDAGADATLPPANDAAARPDGGDTGDAGRRDGGGEIVWGPCDWPTTTTRASTCATVALPLRWEDPNGPTVDVAVRRFPSELGSSGQLWMLEGGPGGSATKLADVLDYVLPAAPSLDIYLIEHRGVGVSTRLGCEPQEALSSEGGAYVTDSEMRACFEAAVARWGADLTAFSAEAAARDLGALIDATRQPGERVFVYGVSYGTWWAHYYLHHFPDQASGVILDSACSPGTCLFPLLFSQNHDRIGRQLLDACGVDSFCSSKIGTDPQATLTQLLTDVESGHCSQVASSGLDADGLRVTLGAFLRDRMYWPLVPSLIYRFRRCDAADVTALTRVGNALFQPRYADQVAPDSIVLQAVVIRSELWDERATTQDALRTAHETQLFMVPFDSVEDFDVLPRYARPAEADFFPSTTTPILLLNGDMDPQTPPWSSDPAGAHYNGAHQHYVVFNRVTHGTLFSSGIDGAPDTCAASIMRQFVTDPQGALDTSCRTNAPAYEWQSSWLGTAFFGTSDLYENGLAAPPIRSADRPRIDALHRRARELVRNERPFRL